MSGGGYGTHLLLSIRSSPSRHQEIVALGEAWGRHSRTTSPPLWMTMDFFTGRRVKSGGEAEEQTRVKAICLPLRKSNSCASAENVKCITSNYWNCISPPDWLIVREELCKWATESTPQWRATQASFYLFIYFSWRKHFHSTDGTIYINYSMSWPFRQFVWYTANNLLTYNLELGAGIGRSIFILCHTLIHPRVDQANPGYGQSTSFHLDPPLQIKRAE